MTEEEKRRRYSRGVQLTPELEEWLMRAVNAQRTGQAVPPPPTRMTGVRVPGDADYVTPIGDEQPRANQGQPEFAPAYVDPRSEAIAQTPALVRPVAGMMDKLFRPGRADVVNEMNRKYLEGLPERQAAQQKLRSEGLLEELRARALEGDADAEAALQRFREADRPPSYRGGGSSGEAWMQLTGEGGDVGRDPASGYRIRRSRQQPTPSDPARTVPTGEPTEEPPPRRGSISPGQRRRSSAAANVARNSKINSLQEQLDNVRAQIAAREADPIASESGGPVRRGMIKKPLQALLDEEAALSQELSNLQQPLTSVPAGSGGATEAGRAQIQ